MVVGIDTFRAHFTGCEHQYVLIGGAACELILSEVGLDSRATKDLDIVLIVEALDAAFSDRFWAFIKAGAYEIGEQASGKKTLYRFRNPRISGYPAMLELFSRTPVGLDFEGEGWLTPLPISDEAASLSAILLDDGYYAFLKSMIRTVDGIPVLDEAAIMPFKARAWLDLSARRAAGDENIDSRDIKKHRSDIARLSQLLSADACINLPANVHEDMKAFLAAMAKDDSFDPRPSGAAPSKEIVIERLRNAYSL